ncbi:hypothetical protein Cspa_c45270 [Clostridium saccharoperbutylacetonicum N1-4(HMT)]|uniref:Uncharacterized protein n=1 Tax=Clostridium saccharoperbutylacetonicum N1-4(HMT) TaxID=931276 RepID=M1LYF5_9CLOT|nr:hypothetical protein Cspa_c45270 [Clostridium saccharoperbutylacetonicum N1-4(HMT)]
MKFRTCHVRSLGTPEEIESFDSEYYKNNC